MRTTLLARVTAALLLLALPKVTEAQGVLTALGAKQIIDDGSKAVDNGLDHATASGNALISHGASALSILIQTINMELGGDIDHLSRNLRPEEITLLGKIKDLTDQLNNLQSGAYDFKDATVIDLSTLEAALPFVRLPYFIERIKGLSQVVSEGDYHMSLTAFGLTPGSQSTASTVRLVDEKTSKEIPTQVNITGNGQASIDIPNAALQPFFNSDRLVVEQVNLEMTVVEQRHLLPDRHIKIVAKVGLALFPKKAGTITVTTYKPTYGWVKVAAEDTPHRANGNGEADHTIRQEVDVPGGGTINPSVGAQMLQNPVAHCVMKSDIAKICTPPQNGWFELIEIPIILNNGTRAEWEGKSYHAPKFLWMSYDRYEYQLTGQAASSKDYDLIWGHTVDVELPDGFSRYKVDGEFVTFQDISLPGGVSSSLMRFDHVTPAPNSVAIYEITAPKD